MKILYAIWAILVLVLFGNLFGIAIWMSFPVIPNVGVFMITVHAVTVCIVGALISASVACVDEINEDGDCDA